MARITMEYTAQEAAIVRAALRAVEADTAESYDAAHRRGDARMIAHYDARARVLEAGGARLDAVLAPTPSPVMRALAASAAAMAGWREDDDVPMPVTVGQLTEAQRARARADWPADVSDVEAA